MASYIAQEAPRKASGVDDKIKTAFTPKAVPTPAPVPTPTPDLTKKPTDAK